MHTNIDVLDSSNQYTFHMLIVIVIGKRSMLDVFCIKLSDYQDRKYVSSMCSLKGTPPVL